MRASTNRNSPSGTPHLLPSPPPTPPHTPLLLHQSRSPPLHAQAPRAPQLRRCTAAPRSVARYRSCGCAHCGCRSARRARKRLGHWQARAFYSRSMRRSGGRCGTTPHPPWLTNARRRAHAHACTGSNVRARARTCASGLRALTPVTHCRQQSARTRAAPCCQPQVPRWPSAAPAVRLRRRTVQPTPLDLFCSPHRSTCFAAHTTQPVLQPTPLNLRWAVCAATARNLRRRSRY